VARAAQAVDRAHHRAYRCQAAIGDDSMTTERQRPKTERELGRVLESIGLDTSPDLFLELVKAAVRSVAWRRSDHPPESTMSATELTTLASVGFDVAQAPREAYVEAVAASAARLTSLLATALSVSEVAARVQISPGRVRQMLNDEHTLYGIKEGGEWRVPDVQLAGNRFVRNLQAVVGAVPRDLHPLAFYNWFVAPSPALSVDHEELLSPRDWLETGGDPEPVAAEAARL
jgi:hypothetical protein